MNTLSLWDENDNPSYVTIPLTHGKVALVDPEDADLLHLKWHVSNGDYAYHSISINGKHRTISLHRTILERKLGRPLAKGMKTDHRNGHGLDNRRENLREATHAQNMQNARLRRNSTSPYKGVIYIKASGMWEARLGISEQSLSCAIGCFPTAKDASFAYDKAALKRYGEFARLNNPLEDVLAWQEPVRRLYKTNTIGYRGVKRRKDQWIARLNWKKRDYWIGTFATPLEAAIAYDRKAIEICGQRAILNFPRSDYGEGEYA